MARRLVKTISWFFGGLFSLALTAYAVLFVVNLDDRQPIAEIATLKSLQHSGMDMVNKNNSYLYMLGFSGPPDADPMTLGFERYEWMETARPEYKTEDDPLGSGYEFRGLRSDCIAELAKACSGSAAECLRSLESDGETVRQWLADERWLLDRYRSLLAMTSFEEAVSLGMFAPLPAYDVVIEGQKLYIADAWAAATKGDATAVKAALDRDLTYWRMVLERSDILITKMIATAAITRHFKLGNIVLRRLSHESGHDGIPVSWRASISEEERSMKRIFAGEWMFFDNVVKGAVADSKSSFDAWMGLADSTVWELGAWIFLEPFLQPQDLSNRHARLMIDLGNTFAVAYEEIPRAVDVADELQESAYRPFSRLYNLTGDIVMTAGGWSFSAYAVRVSDLEGVRRAALLAAELRAEEVNGGDVAERIMVSKLMDPYTNEPFAWVEDEGVIVFQGLELHDTRSFHKLIF